MSDSFYTDLTSILETLAVFNCPLVIAGDLNVHVDNPNDTHARRLLELLDSFGLVQSVVGSTHKAGHTLDLVVT